MKKSSLQCNYCSTLPAPGIFEKLTKVCNIKLLVVLKVNNPQRTHINKEIILNIKNQKKNQFPNKTKKIGIDLVDIYFF